MKTLNQRELSCVPFLLFKLGPMLTIDPKTEQFVGNDSQQANKSHLTNI